MARRKRGKTFKILNQVSEKRKYELGLLIEELMKDSMKFIVWKYVYNYREAVYQTFGWDDDDLLQFIREQLWKGVATFDPSKNFKIETYCSSILYKQFANLSKQCQTNKHSLSKLYCPEELFDSEETTVEETPEDWLNYAQKFRVLWDSLDEQETKILARYLAKGESATKMAESTGYKKTEVIRILKDLKERLKFTLGGLNG